MVDNCINFAQPRRWWAGLLGFAVPPCCLLCGGAAAPAAIDLCGLCESMLPRPQRRLGTLELSAGCVSQVAALDYAWPVDQLIQELKFAGSWPVARVLGHLLAKARCEDGPPWPEAVLPVPLHPLRLAERGFNQAEHIARFACAGLGLRLTTQVLRRQRHTAVQSRLDAAARRENLRGAFSVDERHPSLPQPPWQHVALVDDVLTTGSTLAAATRALRMIGVRKIEWWTAASTTLSARER